MSTSPSSLSIPRPSRRVARFERLGFGLFLHWGLYSLLGKGEWVQANHRIPAKEYQKLSRKFGAEDFDARQIARTAKECGVRYITLTARHHDGFSLYDTRGLSKFDAVHARAGRDLIAEFVEACRAEGIVPMLYHTTLDWRWDSARCSEQKFNEYLDYLHASVEVLCRHYGEIGGFWFDGNWSRRDLDWKEDRLYTMIRRYQPDAMIIDNTGLSALGAVGHRELDSTTFERGLPVMPDRRGWPKYLAGEMCEVMNSHWGIATEDFNYRGPSELIETLCACRKVGANLLLNIGPTATGALPDYETAVLRKMGQWITLHGALLYEGKPVTSVRCKGRDFVLSWKNRYYYFAHSATVSGSAHVVKQIEADYTPRVIDGFKEPVQDIRWLVGDRPVRYGQSIDTGMLTLDCDDGYPYGQNLVVRVAEIKLQKSKPLRKTSL
jgi:alpha-L-fucosidase